MPKSICPVCEGEGTPRTHIGDVSCIVGFHENCPNHGTCRKCRGLGQVDDEEPDDYVGKGAW
jgi:hypothetical protein